MLDRRDRPFADRPLAHACDTADGERPTRFFRSQAASCPVCAALESLSRSR